MFALTKMYRHSIDYHAPPLLVLPAERQRRIGLREPSRLLPAKPLDDERVKDLRKAANLFSDPKNKLYDDFMPAAAAYYEELIGADSLRRLPTSAFLRSHVVSSRRIEPTGNEHFPHLPTSGWHLEVKYKRLPHA